MPEAEPALSGGTFDRAASVDGVAYNPKPTPNSVNPTKAATRYWRASRNVVVVSRIPPAVIQQPVSIGFRGPIFCRSFSPTRIVDRIAIRYPAVSKPDCSEDNPASC